MKKFIKKLSYYPASVTKSVYMNGTSKTLQDAIDDGELFGTTNNRRVHALLKTRINDLVSFKGDFNYEYYLDNASFRTSATKGDFWINKELQQYNVDGSVLTLNGIVYFDGSYFKTIEVPYMNDTKPKGAYDVVIIGAGAGGIGAAYALKDSGWRVAIIEKLDTLGGTHCNAGVANVLPSPICDWYKDLAEGWFNDGIFGFDKHATQSALQGVGTGTDFEKVFRATQFTDNKDVINGFRGNYITPNDYKISQAYYNDFKENIDIYINTEVLETKSTSGKVDYVKVRNIIEGNEFEISADYFIDCSGDGVLFTNDENLVLDTDYFIGSDGQARFNEPVYGADPADPYGINTVEPTYYTTNLKTDEGYSNIPALTQFKRYIGLTANTNFTSIPWGDDDCKTVSHSKGTLMSLEDFIDKPNSWNWNDGKDRITSLKLGVNAGIRKLLAIREKYRVYAEKTVDESYLGLQITSANYQSEKIIALSTWWVDFHNQDYFVTSQIANGIPYESAIPRAYTNVLTGSRCYGASHIGLSSVRLVKTMMDLGHSTGIAIKQLLDNSNVVDGVREDVRTVDVSALQTEIGIASVINDLETYFYGATVTSEDIDL